MGPNLQLGLKIRKARLAAGLSLFQACGTRLSSPHLSMVEHGRRGISARLLLYLTGRYGIPVAQVLPPRLDPADAEEVIREAEDLGRRGEHSRSVEVFQSALQALPPRQPVLRARCMIGIGFGLTNLRQYELAWPYVGRGLRLAEETGEPSLTARAHNTLGAYHLYRNEYRTGLAALEVALHVLRGQARPNPETLAAVLSNIGHAHRELGQAEKALDCFREAAEVAAQLDNDALLGGIARNAASALMNLKRYDEAHQKLLDARAAFTRAERLDRLVFVENGIGILMLETGRAEEATGHLQRAIALAERVGDDLGRARTLNELARAHIILGRLDDAHPAIAEAIRLAMKVNDQLAAARAELLRAGILAARGRPHEAEAALAFVIPIFERGEQRRDLVAAYGLLGDVLRSQGHHERATEVLHRALTLAKMPEQEGS